MNKSMIIACVLLGVAACGGKTDDAAPAGTAGAGGAAAGAAGASAGAAGASAGAAGASAGAAGASAGAAGASAGAAGASAGAGGGDGCYLPGGGVGPFPVKFRLRNTTTQSLAVWETCQVEHTITSCASGFTSPLTTTGSCTVECSDTSTGCIACGACMSAPITLAPGEAKELAWGGNTYTFSTTKTGCPCHDTHIAPAAHYRIAVPVYPDSPSTGPSGPKPAPLHTVTQEFTLPAAGGVVEVSLAP